MCLCSYIYAHRSDKRGVLWLAEYLKRETEMLRPYSIVMQCPDATTQKQ